MMVFDSPADHRSLKVSSVLKRALSQLFVCEFYDLSKIVTISAVKMGEDLRNATILVVVRGGDIEADDMVAALNESSGVIRSAVFKYLSLRCVPRLHFKLDLEFENFLCVNEALSLLRE